MAPKVVTDLDEAELARQMDQLEAENEQVAGDTDSEEETGSEEDEEVEEGLKKKKVEETEDDPKLRAVSGLMTDMHLTNEPEADDDQSWS